MKGLDVQTVSSKTGFSLIELMVVIAIIVTLVALTYPMFLRSRIQAARVEAKVNMKTISAIAKTYHAENGIYPTGSYGYTVSGSTQRENCEVRNTLSESVHLKTYGFSLTGECKKLRYMYTLAAGGVAGFYGFITDEMCRKRFIIRAQSAKYKFTFSSGIYQYGSPPFSPRHCKFYTSVYDYRYADSIYLNDKNENTMDLVYGGEALETCL